MSSLIQSNKKSDFKKDCAYFDLRTILKDEDQGTNGLERGVCRNQRLFNPASCKGCPHFSKHIAVDDRLPEQIGNGRGEFYRELEYEILEWEAGDQVVSDAHEIKEKHRSRVLEIVKDELGVKTVEIGNKRVTAASRNSDKWFPDKVREAITPLLKKKRKGKLLNKVFKNRVTIDIEDPKKVQKVLDFVKTLQDGKSGITAQVDEAFDQGELMNLVSQGLVERNDLVDTYQRKSSYWPVLSDIDRKKDDGQRIIII